MIFNCVCVSYCRSEFFIRSEIYPVCGRQKNAASGYNLTQKSDTDPNPHKYTIRSESSNAIYRSKRKRNTSTKYYKCFEFLLVYFFSINQSVTQSLGHFLSSLVTSYSHIFDRVTELLSYSASQSLSDSLIYIVIHSVY